jgi:hypothetical protein
VRSSTPGLRLLPGSSPGIGRACLGQRAGGVGTLVEQGPQPVVAEPRDAELDRLLELAGAGVGTDDDEVGLLRDTAGDLAAERLHRLRGAVPAERGERAGDDDGNALQRPRSLVGAVVGGARAAGPDALDDVAVARVLEPVVQRLGDDRADAVHGGQLLRRRRHDGVERPELARDVLGRRRADVPDRQARPAAATAGRSRAASTPRRTCSTFFGPEAAQPLERLRGQGEDVADVADAARLQQRDGGLVAQAVDVERPPARRSGRSPRAAARDRPAVLGQRTSTSPLGPAQLGAALRAVRRHDELALGAVAQPEHRADHLGDDVARPPHDHGVADAHVLAPDLVLVVQGASLTMTPPTCTGSMYANGVTRPVRPTLTWMSRSVVVASSGGYLCAIAQRGALLVAPSRRCSGTSSTLTTTPSISCSTSCRCSPQCAM